MVSCHQRKRGAVCEMVERWRGGGGVPEDETEDGVKGGGGGRRERRREGEGLSMYYKFYSVARRDACTICSTCYMM